MTQTHTLTTYQFNELSEDAQEKALEKYWDWNVDDSWWSDFIIDDTKEIAKIIGIDIDNIFFSGFWSQGDGACFEGSYSYAKGSVKAIKAYAPQEFEIHRIAQCLQDIQRKNFYGLWANVKHSGHYYHEMCTQIQVGSDNESMGGANDEAYYEIQELLRDFMRWIYKRLEDEFEYQSSKDVLVESWKANETEFNENGTIYIGR